MLIISAFSIVTLLAISALAIDASFMYDKRNRLYAAADAAAKIAAAELHRDSTLSTTVLTRFANQQVTAHGFTPVGCGATGGTAVCINHPPTTGRFAGDANYVEAILSEPTGTFFGKLLGRTSMTPGAWAVAGNSNPLNCLVTLGPPGTTPASLAFGNTTLALNGCGIGDTGDLSGDNPNAAITGTPTPRVTVTGSCSGTCGAMGTLTTSAPPPSDPLASLPDFTNPYGSCSAGTGTTLSQGCYTSIASSVTTLNAGRYYITGAVDIGNLTGTNVFLYLAGPDGQLKADNNKSLILSAQTSGTYTGIAIFQARGNTQQFDPKNGFTLQVSGAIYMPSVDVEFKNSLIFGQTTCALLVAKTLNIKNGNGSMSNQGCAALFGGAMFTTVAVAE
jgi:hypothetical protein